MQAGVVASVIAHVAVIAVMVFGLPMWAKDKPLDVPAIPIEFIPADVIDIAKGVEKAEKREEISTIEAKPEPKAEPPKEEPPPPPPPPPVVERQPDPEPEPAAAEKAPEKTVEAPPPEPVPAPQPPARVEPPPPPKPPEKVAVAPVPKPKPKPTPPVVAPPAPKKDVLTDRVAALLDQSAKPPPSKPASAGAATGSVAGKNTADERAAVAGWFADTLNRCWGWSDNTKNVPVEVKFKLTKDGTLSGDVQVTAASSPFAEEAVRRARAAVNACLPLKPPKGDYALWQDIVFSFGQSGG